MAGFTKGEFVKRLKAIKKQGWIPSHRQGNDGGIGNTLEDLLDKQGCRRSPEKLA